MTKEEFKQAFLNEFPDAIDCHMFYDCAVAFKDEEHFDDYYDTPEYSWLHDNCPDNLVYQIVPSNYDEIPPMVLFAIKQPEHAYFTIAGAAELHNIDFNGEILKYKVCKDCIVVYSSTYFAIWSKYVRIDTPTDCRHWVQRPSNFDLLLETLS